MSTYTGERVQRQRRNRSGGTNVQAQQSSAAARRSEISGSLAFGAMLLWGVVFSLPVVLLQVSLLYVFKIDYPIVLRYGLRDGIILLLFAVAELFCSFLA